MSAPTLVRDYLPRAVPLPGNRRRFMHVVERQVMVYRRFWALLASGFVEPFLFLGSIGIGVGGLVQKSNGNPVSNAKVNIYAGNGTTLLGTVFTDSDGWYDFGYAGSTPATFVVKLPKYGKNTTTTLNSPGFVVVNFVVS